VIVRARTDPEHVEQSAVARSCRSIAEWLLESDDPLLALGFAEAAARLNLEHPANANLAGRSARRARILYRSEIWFDRAQIFSAQQHNRRELIWALLGRGVLLKIMDDYSGAWDCFDKAARFASSTRRSRLAAMAHHEMLAIAAERGDYTEGEAHAWEALFHYPLHHPALPNLLHDFIVLLIRINLFAEAFTLGRAVLPHCADRPGVQAIAASVVARAAANLGEYKAYRDAREVALSWPLDSVEFSAAICVNLAEAARALGNTAEARSLIARALPIARSQGDEIVLRAAFRLRDELDRGLPGPVQAAPPPESNLTLLMRLMLSRLRQRGKRKPRPVKVDTEASGRMDRPLAS
jgi:tetratricopeptide (TPR) repeat protein